MSYPTRSKTYASAALADTDGLVVSAATVTSASEVLPAGMVGLGVLDFPRTVTVTSSSAVGAYATAAPIVVTGKRGGSVVTDSLQLTAENGGETIRGTQVFDVVTHIAKPAQADTDGALTFGVQDIYAPAGDTFSGVMVDTAVTVHLAFGSGQTDAIPLAAKSRLDLGFSGILTGASQTSGAAVTVFHGRAKT